MLVVLSASSFGEVVIRRFELETPRDFGYFIGDVVRHRVGLELSHPYRLDQARLPKEGRYDLWLELGEPMVSEFQENDHVRYQIDLSYRIVNNPDAAITVFTPLIPLVARGEGQTLTKDAPSWGFTVSPLTVPGAGERVAIGSIRPDHLPPALGLGLSKIVLAASSAALLGLLAHLLHMRWGLPGSARRRRPFARAHRDLRSLARQPVSGALYASLLQRFHLAVNEAAGKAVFAGNLESFFAQQPSLRVLRPRIEAVFEHSVDVFFREGAPSDPDADDIRSLVHLAHQCRLAER
jgi:mxaA protein